MQNPFLALNLKYNQTKIPNPGEIDYKYFHEFFEIMDIFRELYGNGSCCINFSRETLMLTLRDNWGITCDEANNCIDTMLLSGYLHMTGADWLLYGYHEDEA